MRKGGRSAPTVMAKRLGNEGDCSSFGQNEDGWSWTCG